MTDAESSPRTFHEWTPISASFEPGSLGVHKYVVLFARNRGDGWEFARDTIRESSLESIDSEGVLPDAE